MRVVTLGSGREYDQPQVSPGTARVHLAAPGVPCSLDMGRNGAFLIRGEGCGGPLALTLLFGFSDQPRAECYTHEHHTIPWFASLCETLVRAIGMQADRLFLPIKAADGTAPVLGMEDQRAPLETQGARAAPWFAYPSLCRLQCMQLATHEPGAYEVP